MESWSNQTLELLSRYMNEEVIMPADGIYIEPTTISDDNESNYKSITSFIVESDKGNIHLIGKRVKFFINRASALRQGLRNINIITGVIDSGHIKVMPEDKEDIRRDPGLLGDGKGIMISSSSVQKMKILGGDSIANDFKSRIRKMFS